MKTKALVDSLADTLAEKEPEKEDETLGDLQAETYMQTEDGGSDTTATMANVKADPLVEPLADTPKRSAGRKIKGHTARGVGRSTT